MEKNLVVWDEKFSIGIPLIDGEHKKLITLCNNLYKVIINGNSISNEKRKEAMKAALKECAEYSKFHFKHEENLMELCHFNIEKFSKHKSEHRRFAIKIFSEIQNFDSENRISSYTFVKYLYNWTLTHIAHSDRLYVGDLMEFLKNHPEIKK